MIRDRDRDRRRPRLPGIRPEVAERIKERLAASDGMVLIWALLAVLVLSVTSASAITVVTSNEAGFGHDNRSTSALNIAEAGLSSAVAAIEAGSADATSAANNGTLDGGTWSYTAARTLNDPNVANVYTWTITSTGTLGPTQHIVQLKLGETVTVTSSQQQQTVTTPASAVYGYGMFLGSASSDCTTSGTNANTFSGSAQVTVSTYIAGSLCTSGGSLPEIAEPPGSLGGTVTLYVGNKLKSSGNASPFGTSTIKLKQATIVGGCVDANHNVAVPCSKQGNPTSNTNSAGYGSGVWANAYSSTQSSVTKPAVDTTWYSNAEPGPAHPCNSYGSNVSTYPNDSQTGSQPWSQTKFMQHVLDGDATRNTSVGNVDPLELVNNWNQLMNSFDCRFYDSSGNLVGRLAWVYPAGGMTSSNPGTLYISGTVFIDGNLNLSGSDYALYQGVGTIYVNGTVTMSGGTKICAQPISGSACAGNYNPAANLLEIVAMNAGNAATGWNISGAGTYEGIAFVNGQFNSSGGSSVNGAVIADSANMSGAAKFSSTINPPPGAPGAATTTTTTVTTTGPDQGSWANVPGSWQQIS